jgi:hypothetical protein
MQYLTVRWPPKHLSCTFLTTVAGGALALSLPDGYLLALQIWRTEAVSKHLEESGGGVLPLMAVVVATIAAVACGLGLYEHSSAIGELLFATSPEGWAALLQGVPWAAIFWTALFSTDLLLLIEVCFTLPAAVVAKLLFSLPTSGGTRGWGPVWFRHAICYPAEWVTLHVSCRYVVSFGQCLPAE